MTHRVGDKKPNAFGLYDMHGNVWEWVQDCWHDSYDGAFPDGSPQMASDDCRRRVARGGSWYIGPEYLRSANRLWIAADNPNDNLGFRVVRTLSARAGTVAPGEHK